MQGKFKFLVRLFPFLFSFTVFFFFLIIYEWMYVLLLSGTISGQTCGWNVSWFLAERSYNNISPNGVADPLPRA